MKSPKNILGQYWGFDQFRPKQEDIIKSVLDGKDTLALLPTGGGKSICFQIPAIAMDGICIVVSPLIALMKDQVANLKRREIQAMCITSENSYREVDAMFDRCIFGDIKFLYLSPERLQSDIAKARIPQMKVNLIAVDEAHCISEWGYDFRPPYLKIADIRAFHPKVPIIALTASATPMVVDDIQEKLQFKKPNVITNSFARENLAYFVEWDENKLAKAERIAKKLKGSGIIYTRSRKGTERITRELRKRGLNVDFYHAGLENEVRSQKQEDWMQGKTQIIATTNAFGMGIDKSNVRFVLHFDLPDTLENYYQECGRGGRDGKKAFAVTLLARKDMVRFREKLAQAFPEKSDINRVYTAIGNQLQLAIGSGKDERFPLDIETIANQYDLNERLIVQCIKFLEREEYVALDESRDRNSYLQVLCSNEELYNLKVQNIKLEPLINGLLRSYGRLFDEEVKISEWTLCQRIKWSKDRVIKGLDYMHQRELVKYTKATHLPTITYTKERLDSKNISISDEHYKLRKHVVIEKAEAMLNYAEFEGKCRSRMILEYFGEVDAADCGICDICITSKT
ncbi:RecQ family ATP-dependent DNA helicase [Salibacteraceae bacterium]|nr:RecQ family ATP-dependent DNA helicase [Salibacteraceae bacterium]